MKFELLQYGLHKEIKQTATYFSYDGSPIEVKYDIKRLGVTMSCDAPFSELIQSAVQSVPNQMGRILRTLPLGRKSQWSFYTMHLFYQSLNAVASFGTVNDLPKTSTENHSTHLHQKDILCACKTSTTMVCTLYLGSTK